MFTKLNPTIKYRIYSNGERSDFSTQTPEDFTCYLCNYQWETVYDLYSHLITQCHKNNKYLTCLRCKFKLNQLSIEEHDCFKNKSTFVKHLCFNSIKFGLPFICLLCQGRKFRSKTVLFVHLICYHSPNITNPNKCGDCPQYNEEFDRHIEENHVYGYDMSFMQQLNLDTERRHPYACVSCSSILNGNDQFHAHVICQHTTKNEYDKDLFVCLVCNIPYWTAEKIAEHINNTHTSLYRQLAIQLSKYGSLFNYIDLQTTCIYCWTYFEKRLQLHAHLIMNHSYFSMSIQCGLCNMDFKINKQLCETYDLYNRHSEAHFKQFELNLLTKVDVFCVPIILSKNHFNNSNNKKKNRKTRKPANI